MLSPGQQIHCREDKRLEKVNFFPQDAHHPVEDRRRVRRELEIKIGLPGGSDGKESACNAGNPGLIPGSGRSPEGIGNPLQYSYLENPLDRADCGLQSMGSQGQTRLSD